MWNFEFKIKQYIRHKIENIEYISQVKQIASDYLVWALAATMADVFIQQDISVVVVPNNIKNSTSLPQKNQNLNQTTNSHHLSQQNQIKTLSTNFYGLSLP